MYPKRFLHFVPRKIQSAAGRNSSAQNSFNKFGSPKISGHFFVLLVTICVFIGARTTSSNWVQVNNGLAVPNVNALCSYTAGGTNYIFAATQYIGGNNGVIFLSTDNGNLWSMSVNWPNSVFSLAYNGSQLFAATQNGLAYTTNNGASWNTVGGPNPPDWSFSVAAAGSYVLSGTFNYANVDTGGVYISSNNGLNWSRIMILPITNAGYGYKVAINGNYFYASNSNNNNLYVSSDFGSNWLTYNVNFPVVSYAFNAGYVFAGTNGSLGHAVYRSSNNGANWAPTTLDSVFIYSVITYGSFIFAGGAGGSAFWESNDNGNSWTGRGGSEGLGGTPTGLCVSNGYIFASTLAQGIYRRPLSEITAISQVSQEIPTAFKLSQNYPNPFNPSTRIKFSIPKRSFAELRVYDILGRLKELPLSQYVNASEHELTLDCSTYSCGVYFYQLISDGNIIETKKMVVLK